MIRFLVFLVAVLMVIEAGNLRAQSATFVGPYLSFTAGVATPENFLDVGTPTRLGLGVSLLRQFTPRFFARVNAGLRFEMADFAWAPEQFLKKPWEAAESTTQVVVAPASNESRTITSSVSVSAIEVSPTVHVRAFQFTSNPDEVDGLFVGAGVMVDHLLSFTDTQNWSQVEGRPALAPRTYEESFEATTGVGGVVSAMAIFALGGSRLSLEVAYVTRSSATPEGNVYMWLPGRGVRVTAALGL